jgi:hypothetical protein
VLTGSGSKGVSQLVAYTPSTPSLFEGLKAKASLPDLQEKAKNR